MKVYAIFAVARQIGGDFVIARPEGAFWEASEAEVFHTTLQKKTVEQVPTEFGAVQCHVERAIFVLDLPEKLPEKHAADPDNPALPA